MILQAIMRHDLSPVHSTKPAPHFAGSRKAESYDVLR